MRSLGVWEFGSLDNSFKEFGSLDNSFKEFGSLDNSFKEFGSLGVWEFGQYLFILNTQAGRLIIHFPLSIVWKPGGG